MQARILFLTDLHKRDTDFTTITGYTSAIDCVQEDILRFIKDNNVTHLIIGGDWYDKGYRSINRAYNDRYYDEAISAAVNGNVYLCRGNHIYLERDSNPEMYLIQPCPDMPLAKNIKMPEKQLFKTPPYVQIGPIQISLFHFSKDNKNYVMERNPETTFHIGVFHDDVMIPSSVRQAAGDMQYTTTSALAAYYNNLDLAICNHIHMAVGRVDIHLTNKKVPCYIPGALCITANKLNEIHDSVQLPLITLEDDDKVRMQLATFSLHTELLKMYDKKAATSADTKSAVAGKKAFGELKTVLAADPTIMNSLKDALISKHYTPEHLKVIQEIYDNNISVNALIKRLESIRQEA